MSTSKEPFLINHIHLTGRVGQEPRSLNGKGWRFSIAQGGAKKSGTDENWPTEWFSVIAWTTECPEAAGIHKGTLVDVRGRLKPTSWTKDGVEHKSMDIVASQIIPVE